MAFLCSKPISFTSAAFIYHVYILYLCFEIPMMYILYIICNLNFKYWCAFPQQMKTHYGFDCKWIDRVVSKCCSNITQYFCLTNHIVVFFSHIQSKCLCLHIYDWFYLFTGNCHYLLEYFIYFGFECGKRTSEGKVWNSEKQKKTKEEEISNTYYCVLSIVICSCVMVWARTKNGKTQLESD